MNMNQPGSKQNQTAVNSLKNVQSGLQVQQTTRQIRYATANSPTRPTILTQEITADLQLSQEAWDHFSNQMNEIEIQKQ